MSIGDQILFFFAGLGVFNGFLLAIYFLFFLKPRKWVNPLFGLLMLMLCIRIGKSLFVVFTEVPRIYRQIGLSACILIGPFLYLYLKAFLDKQSVNKTLDRISWILPGLAILLVGSIWPYERFPDFWNKYVVHGIYAVWIFFMLLAFNTIWPTVQQFLRGKRTIAANWMLLLYSCIFVLCLAFNLALYGFPYLAGPLLFSLVLYLLTGFMVGKKNRSVVLMEINPKYQNRPLAAEKSGLLLSRLTQLMEQKKPYLNPKIKLAELAQGIDSTPHEVSQLLNHHLGKSFNQYINGFRIKVACEMLQNMDHLTIEGIGREVGFTSKTAFYTAFKQVTQQTPGQYKAQLSRQPRSEL
ncbi:MAG: AraC family transcriptional regulator [Bacteroidota bacterium]